MCDNPWNMFTEGYWTHWLITCTEFLAQDLILRSSPGWMSHFSEVSSSLSSHCPHPLPSDLLVTSRCGQDDFLGPLTPDLITCRVFWIMVCNQLWHKQRLERGLFTRAQFLGARYLHKASSVRGCCVKLRLPNYPAEGASPRLALPQPSECQMPVHSSRL